MKKFLFAIILMLFFMAGTASAANILVNPGFETGSLSPWSQGSSYSDGEDWNVTAADSHSGQYSATDTGNKQLIQTFGSILGSNITEASFWLKNVDASINAVFFNYSDDTYAQNILYTSDIWTRYDVTSYLDPNKYLVSFGIWGVYGGATQRTFVDDWTLSTGASPVPEPATMLLLGSGLIGLTGFRKRFFKK